MQGSQPPERTALYRFYDTDGRLLYVGVTNDLEYRWGQHAASKSWWSEVAEKRAEWFEDRSAALAAEREAIRSERPRHNHQHNPSGIIDQIRPHNLGDLNGAPWRPFEFIANDLRRLIKDGSARPGDKLPTVRDLCGVYSVSSVTVQRALALLKSEGFAQGRAGFGVIATLPPGFRQEVATVTAEVEGAIEMLTASDASRPSPVMCEALQVGRGAVVRGRTWVRYVDKTPVELVSHFDHPDSRADDRAHHAGDLLSAQPPTTRWVETLHNAGTPVLVIVRTIFAADGRVIAAQEIIKSGHLLSVTYEY